MPEYFGRYESPVKTQWLNDGRTMKLLTKFTFIDPQEIRWEAPVASIVDGASIPKFAWSIIGGPFEGKYRDASVIHDVACAQKVRPWESVHEVFYNAMRTSGVGVIKAKIMYAAVYHFGPRWSLSYATVIPRTQVEAVIGKLKASLDPQSQLRVNISLKRRSSLAILTKLPEQVKVNVNVVPSSPTLRETDFAQLEKAIAAKGLTLQDIRNFKPSAD